MIITYGELKNRLTDFGFEEDDVAESDYKRIYINSFNHAAEIIYNAVMLQIEGYIRHSEDLITGDEDIVINATLPTVDALNGGFKRITKITEDTDDDSEIYVPEIVLPLWTLLTAHYAWLDDDLTKAMIYWNEYDDLKNQIIANANMPRRAMIVGGVRW